MKTLLEKVRAIDKDAADYIQSEVLPRYELTGKIPPDELDTLFMWGLTPQGNEYWLEIYKQIEPDVLPWWKVVFIEIKSFFKRFF